MTPKSLITVCERHLLDLFRLLFSTCLQFTCVFVYQACELVKQLKSCSHLFNLIVSMQQATRLYPLLGFLTRRVASVSRTPCWTKVSSTSSLPAFHHVPRCPFASHHQANGKNQSKPPPINQPKDGNISKETENIAERYWETFEAELKQLSLFQRYKKMFKEFWYVGIPVVGITSLMWFSTFYFIACSGIVKPLIKKLRHYGVPETIAKPLESEKLGPVAVTFLLYKLATPARYAVSVAGTVQAIKILLKRGLIKPMPPKDKLKEMVLKKVYEKKDSLKKP